MKIMTMLMALALAGCASLQNAGTAEYYVKPFLDGSGNAVCCEVQVRNGKEIANLETHIERKGDHYTVDLKEQGVAAFKGQEISAAVLKSIVTEAVKAALVLGM